MHEEYSTEELRERAELTDRIVANLQAINADENNLEELLIDSNQIVSNLQVIDADENNLAELINDTDQIVGNLCKINA
jgi:hypothetical protein